MAWLFVTRISITNFQLLLVLNNVVLRSSRIFSSTYISLITPFPCSKDHGISLQRTHLAPSKKIFSLRPRPCYMTNSQITSFLYLHFSHLLVLLEVTLSLSFEVFKISQICWTIRYLKIYLPIYCPILTSLYQWPDHWQFYKCTQLSLRIFPKGFPQNIYHFDNMQYNCIMQ